VAEAAVPMRSLPGWLVAPLLALAAARGHLFPLAAVALAVGDGVWFGWPSEPGLAVYAAALALALAGLALLLAAPDLARPLGGLALALALGFLAAGTRAHLQAAPVLGFRYYGPVEGRVIAIDRSSSDALRLTLDRVVLREVAPERTPQKVRVALHGNRVWHVAAPGQTVILTAHLAPPEGPVEPGGFDFRRMAFFDRLGAVGYTGTPVLLLEEAGAGEEMIGRLRQFLSDRIRAAIPGEAGAFAAGAMTGDRSGISQATVEALRDSSLAHILAISGMNMAFLTAFVFGLIRGGIALVPWLALRVNAKKVAAAISFLVALFYLQLSGSNVATERAFLMISVMLGAVMLDRRALTLRSVAIAAVILLVLRPESLLEPGFQMSFAATVALIAGFQVLDRRVMIGRWPRWAVPAFTLVASSLIGGFSTAPYAAAHFNRFADLGLVANLLTVPVMGILIMPMGVLAALLAPFGLAFLPLFFMGLGAEWTLYVAYRIAAFEGSVTAIPAPGTGVLAAFTLGACWLLLWPGRARLAGLVLAVLALAFWGWQGRPALLISGDGRLVGLMTPEGRSLSRASGGGFAAENWLENDGDLAGQKAAAARAGFTGPGEARAFTFAGRPAIALSGKDAAGSVAAACAGGLIVVVAGTAAVAPEGCALIDDALRRETGALALDTGAAGVTVTATRARARLWDGRPMDPAGLARLVAALARPLAAPRHRRGVRASGVARRRSASVPRRCRRRSKSSPAPQAISASATGHNPATGLRRCPSR
jgi:competence protein ComEC